MEQEKWLDVPGYPPETYQVSDQGRVRSMKREVHRKVGRPLSLPERILKPAKTARGDLQVVLSHKGKSRTWKVHTLVLLAHVGPRLKGKEVVFANGNKSDCRLSNLSFGRVPREDKYHRLVRQRDEAVEYLTKLDVNWQTEAR